MIRSFLDLNIITLGSLSFNVEHLISVIGITLIAYVLYKKVLKTYMPKMYDFFNVSKENGGKLRKIVRNLIILISIQILIQALNLDYLIYEREKFHLSISLIIKVLIIYQISAFLIWGVDHIIHSYYITRKTTEKEEIEHDVRKEYSVISVVRYIIYLFAIYAVLLSLGLDFSYTMFDGKLNIGLTQLIETIQIILIARLIVWLLTQYVLFNIYKKKHIPFAQRFAINQLILYVVYVLAIFIALEHLLEAQMTVLYGGAAALLVGVGLGLQQTFNDFFSGLVLLFERSVGVGDVIEVESKVGKVLKIGMRSSLVQTRDSSTIVVPNSKMVNFNVLNISHEIEVTRFEILVSVAYGTDTRLVKKLLLESLVGVRSVMKRPASSVQFMNFGADGLDFRLLFYTKELFYVEVIQSEIRFNIDDLFRANDITIPFPQRQIWISKEE